MKKMLILILFLACLTSNAQIDNNNLSLAHQIRKNFNYDTLTSLSCINVPPGIYAIVFKVDNKGRFYDFKANNDSLSSLNFLFIDAIKKGNQYIASGNLKKHTYIQLIYFSNVVGCNLYRDSNNSIIELPPDGAIDISKSFDKEIIKMLSGQLSSIENSVFGLQKNNFQDQAPIYLPIAFINNQNPNLDNSNPSLKNDIRQKVISKADLEIAEKSIEDTKKNRNKKKD